jgi:hypothetical protein
VVKVVEVWDEVEMRWGHRGQKSDVGEGSQGNQRETEGEASDAEAERRKDTEWVMRLPEGRVGPYHTP